MQTRVSKILLTTVIILTCSVCSLHAQASLAKGDSLFRVKQYTQSLDTYSKIFQAGQYSPAMLLKMAYIQEGLGRVSRSIYYLQLYYHTTNDEQAMRKIEDLAVKNRLEGYAPASSDKLFFRQVLTNYSTPISGALLALTLFFFALIIYKKRKENKRPMWAAFLVLLFMGALFAQVNFTGHTQQGIVSESSTYLMSGPSAGASVVAVIGEGHQLEVTGHKDVWLRVQWLNNEVFVKEDKLMVVAL